MLLKLLMLLCAGLCACTNTPYRGKDVVGADEFVIDSYKIREGKFAVLQMEGRSIETLSPELLEEYKDVIHEGDVLQIVVYHPTRVDISASVQAIASQLGFRVDGGKVVLPDLEAIEVEGLTLDEGKEKIQKKYRQQIQDVEVFLTYRDRIQRKVELAGLVQMPSVPVDGRIRLFEVLSLAKVPTSANLFRSYVVRDCQPLPVDLYKLLKEGDMKQNIVMRGGDKIYIADPADSHIMILGEVGQEILLDVPHGFMTLREALAAAKGIPFTGDRSCIQVIRGNILHPKVYTLSWHHMVRMRTDCMLLIPGDIVYVAATPIAQWNRFVTQVLPTLIGIDLVTKGVKNIGVNVP